MLTKEQIQVIMEAVQEHPDCEMLFDRLDDAICNELEVNSRRLAEAIIQDDVDGIINAFTGWDMESLLERARIIPDRNRSFISFGKTPDDVVFKVMPWEQPTATEPCRFTSRTPIFTPFREGRQRLEDYTYELCPECEEEVVIYSSGISVCPSCGKPVAPCSECEENGGDNLACHEGCHGEHKVTNPMISQEEIDWYKKEDAAWLAAYQEQNKKV